jgi:hypothetical protein
LIRLSLGASAVARDYVVSRRWVQTLVAQYLAEGEAAFEPKPRRPDTSPRRTSQAVEDAIVAVRTDVRWLCSRVIICLELPGS